MARSRSIPTQLFWDPDFSLLDSDTQIIFIGLTLIADDEGRGLAQTRYLVRQFDKDAALIEQALTTLAAIGILQCYRVEGQQYYQHLRWQEWETLSKPTASRFPAPPHPASPHTSEQGSPQSADLPQEISGFPRNTSPEEEGEEKRKHEQEEQQKRKSEAHEQGANGDRRVVPFPSPTHSNDHNSFSHSQQHIAEQTSQIAQILGLPISAALNRIVEEYGQDSAISLCGEADAAREWIENAQRNQRGQAMTPAFFRRWLKRERQQVLSRQPQTLQATRTAGVERTHAPSFQDVRPTEYPVSPQDPYQAFLVRREREVLEQLTPREAVAGGRA